MTPIKRRTVRRVKKGKGGKEKGRKIPPFFPEFPRELAPGGRERPRIGSIRGENYGDFAVEEASPVGFFLRCEHSGERGSGWGEAKMGEKTKKQRRR